MSRSLRSMGVAAAGLLLVFAVGACNAAAVPSTPGAVASPDAPAPTPFPTPVATDDPSGPVKTPGAGGVDGAVIPLDVFLDHEVTLAFSDPDGLIVDAASGSAKDGMSVRWSEAIVRNVDPKTVEITWSGLPGDEAVTLVARPEAKGLLLRFGQHAPPADSDAMGADRVAVLTFASPVDAADIVTDFTTADD
ncbi:MAG TPA: hypothetical protein VGK16_12980 [Candidatus Limnocylindrales bacterium]